MGKIRYEGTEEFKPISAWGYVGYTLLFAIPVVGWIFLIVFSFSSKKINRRNFARHYWCYLIIGVILFLGSIVLTRLGVGNYSDSIKNISPEMRQVVETLENLIPARPQNIDNSSGRQTSVTTTSKLTATVKPASVTSAPTEIATVTAKPADSGASTAGVREEVKDAIDEYEAFFKKYAEFMKKYANSSNPLSMMTDYTNMLTQYADMAAKWEKFDKTYSDMNDAELKYYTDATLRIEKSLMDIIE